MKRHSAPAWTSATTISRSLALLPPLVALFFDRGTTTIFEPDKLALFRASVLLLIGWQLSLWLLKLQPGPPTLATHRARPGAAGDDTPGRVLLDCAPLVHLGKLRTRPGTPHAAVTSRLYLPGLQIPRRPPTE